VNIETLSSQKDHNSFTDDIALKVPKTKNCSIITVEHLDDSTHKSRIPSPFHNKTLKDNNSNSFSGFLGIMPLTNKNI
jgi:hypothetical protein